MPKKIPGQLTVDFVVVADDGTAESGTVRAESNRVHFKTMQKVQAAVKKVQSEQGKPDEPEPAAVKP